MEIADRRTPYLLIAPMTLFLIALLALPFVIDLIYAVSRVTFETLRTPSFRGLGNFATVLQDSTGLPVRLADDPMNCVALGAGRTLEDQVYRGALIPA